MKAKTICVLDAGGSPDLKSDPERATVDVGSNRYYFDSVYPTSAQVGQIHAASVMPLLDFFFDGFNASVLVFGSSESARAELIHGYSPQSGESSEFKEGLLNLLMKSICERLELRENANFTVTVQMFQACGELIRDLFEPSKQTLLVEDDAVKGVTIPGLSKAPLDSLPGSHELQRKLHESFERFVESPTQCEFYVFELSKDDKVTEVLSSEIKGSTTSKFTIVKMFGTELIFENANKLILREGLYVAKPIVALSSAIQTFGVPKKNIVFDFEQSVVTRLLQDEFGGNSIVSFLFVLRGKDDTNFNHAMMTLSEKLGIIRTSPVRNTSYVKDLRIRLYVSLEPKCGMNKFIATLESQNGKLKETIELLQARSNDMSKRFSSMEATIHGLELTCKQKEKERLLLKSEIVDLKLEMSKSHQETETANEATTTKLRDLEKACETAEKKLEIATEELTDLRQKISLVSSEKQTESEEKVALDEKLRELEKKCKALENKNTEVGLELICSMNRQGEFSKGHSSSVEEISRLKRQYAHGDNKFLNERLEMKQKSHFETLNKLDRQLKHEEEIKKSAVQERALLEQNITELNSEIVRLKEDMDELKRASDSSVADLTADAESKCATLEDRIRLLEEQLQKAQMNANVATRKFEACCHTVREKEHIVARLQSEVDKLELNQNLILEEYRSKLERMTKDMVGITSVLSSDKEMSLTEIKSQADRVFKEIISTYINNEKRLQKELEVKKAMEATIVKSGSSDNDYIKSQIGEFTKKVQMELEKERSSLLTRAVVAEQLLAEMKQGLS
ncbi:hypothetical protein HK101_004023, partial [Irineochytrium annulatum]